MKTKLKFIRFFSTTPKPSAGNVRTPSSWKSTRVSVSPGAAWVANAYLTRILTAQVYEVAHETPMQYAPNLSALLGNKVYLKREDTQPVFSFKIRGAFNKIASLSEEARRKGVVTCSAGNHAQGVALSANRLEIQATIVMPLATPNIKVTFLRFCIIIFTLHSTVS
jgi:threonine synthase